MKKGAYFFISVLVVLFDQITKYIARAAIAPSEVVSVLPFLRLVSVRNEGAAFGLFRGLGNIPFIVVSLVAIAVIVYLMQKNKEDARALSLILGGALGNLADRVVFGNVTDFIDIFAGRFHWPAFNIADSALTIGFLLLLTKSLLRSKRPETA